MKKETQNVSLRIVNKTDFEFLFEILKERKKNVNISHKVMPTYEQHEKFVLTKPYSKWYIILQNKNRVGSIYLSKQNEIGIFLKKRFSNMGIGTFALKLLIKKNPRKQYLANINPKNKKSIQFFKNNGFEILQHTYELHIESKI